MGASAGHRLETPDDGHVPTAARVHLVAQLSDQVGKGDVHQGGVLEKAPTVRAKAWAFGWLTVKVVPFIRNRLDPFLFWWSTPKALLAEADIPDELLLVMSGTLQGGFLSRPAAWRSRG
jgi:hypothetical protein